MDANIEKRLLIMQPYADCGTLEIRNYFLDREWQVVTISPDQKHYHPKSVLLIPDTGGINANISYFKRESKLPPNIPPQDQALEYFRVETLSWYMKKQDEGKGKNGILGIGMSAFLTFAEVLGGSVYRKDGEMCFGHTTTDSEVNERFFHNRQKRVAGLVSPTLGDIYNMATTLLKGGDGEDAVPVMVPKSPRALLDSI
jgi:hypothetical protein